MIVRLTKRKITKIVIHDFGRIDRGVLTLDNQPIIKF